MTAAREQILTALRERILAYAASRIGRDQAEDLAQETLLLLEEKYAHLEAMEDLLPLSFQVVRYKIAGFLRKGARRGEFHAAQVDELPLPDGGPDPLAEAERKQLEQRLQEALAKLDGRCRQMFRYKLEGMSFAEIQQAMRAESINTVYTWDFRCRKRLLELMGGSWEKWK
ncbi:MAG: sigma-70 family RNA polymerase sigma factor [Acidimicrobiia bacterium]|nr:sigma-70 family RNA polymerase sigma factor [Acidimicrobiia bacterium]